MRKYKSEEESNNENAPITKGPFAYSTSSEDSSFSPDNVTYQQIKRRKIKIKPQDTACTSKETNNQQPEKEIVVMVAIVLILFILINYLNLL